MTTAPVISTDARRSPWVQMAPDEHSAHSHSTLTSKDINLGSVYALTGSAHSFGTYSSP